MFVVFVGVVLFFDVDGCSYGGGLMWFGFIQLKCMLICLSELVGLLYYTIGLGRSLFLCAIVEVFK